jgi:hypothetical protein
VVMIMKDLLSSYNINILTIHEAWNAKVLCLFAKAASSGPFVFCTILYNMHFFRSTMAAAGPARGELVPAMVDQ